VKSFQISVRRLVEFVLCYGDIESAFTGGIQANQRALEGTRLHQKLQKAEMKKAGSDYRKEVPFKETLYLHEDAFSHEEEGALAELVLEGRADGIYTDHGVTVIDEIKSIAMKPELVTEDTYPLHWAQAKCYAWFYLCGEGASGDSTLEKEIDVRLSYIQVDSEEVKYLYRHYTRSDLEAFYQDLLGRYHRWLYFKVTWEKTRNESLKAMQFPFEQYREGQRTMAASVYRAISSGEKLFLQAPTGIGKTMSALFPALKAMSEDKAEMLFYLTAKNVTKEAALAAVKILTEKSGLRLKTVVITAKDRICLLEKRDCRSQACEAAKGHYDRILNACFEMLNRYDLMDGETILKAAQTYNVCPFELSLDLASWADLLICDYNYAFDPSASLKRFFQDGSSSDYVLLVDEAHNLVDRARSMYTASLSKQAWLDLRRTLPKNSPLVRSVSRLNTLLLEAKKSLGEEKFARLESMDDGWRNNLYYALLRLQTRLEEFFESMRVSGMARRAETEAAYQCYFDLLFFRRVYEAADPGYVNYIEVIGNEVLLRLFCVDPANQLLEVMSRVKSVIFFSATLMPIEYYKRLSGGTPADKAYALPSPFPRENRKVMVSRLNMTYRYRRENIPALVNLIHTAYAAHPGHYLVFFPSFAFLEETKTAYEDAFLGDPLFCQESRMSEKEREAFLDGFRSDEAPRIGFAVLGGVFSEGIDLKGESLIGVIVVTVGLPQLGTERNLIKEHLERMNDAVIRGRGFEYAYQFPGLGRVFQAAGRVIRTETDRGIILLVDDRFDSSRYRGLLPSEWYEEGQNRLEVVNETNLEEKLKKFWNQ